MQNAADVLTEIPRSAEFLRQVDAWRLAQEDPPSREVALWILACDLSPADGSLAAE